MKLSKLLLAVVGATVLLGAFVSSASATRLSSSTQTISANWARMNFSATFGTVECAVTLSGSLHSRTITKTRGSLIGLITDARVGACARGEAQVLTATLPWHVQYESFAGTLPTITSITTRVIGSSFRAGFFGIGCLSRTEAANPATGTYNLSAGRVTSVTVGGRIPTSCGDVGTLSGTSTSNTAQTITLI
jgi:hypothetical protein